MSHLHLARTVLSHSLAAALSLAAGSALAVTTYDNLASFQAGTGATSATGPLPAIGITSSATIGSVTVQAPSWLTVDWITALPGYEIGVSNGAGNTNVPNGYYNDGIDVNFASPVYAAGFEFYQPTTPGVYLNGCNVPVCVDSQYQVELKLGSTSVGVFAWTPGKDKVDFWGVASSQAFNRMEIRETVGTDDNEFYGQFYTSSLAPVPEPSTSTLMLLGAAGLVVVRRRRYAA
jgi:hypothetical protein